MRIRLVCATVLAYALACLFSATAPAQVHPHHAQQIRKAAKEVKPRVAPKKPRTVLIWNTPPSLMDKDPHKGYCIPYGEEGMRAVGEASGAFKPVVSDDIAMYTPENIKQFDAIVLNNASGAWITPTAADMAKAALKRHGADAKEVEKVLRKSFLDFLDQVGRQYLHGLGLTGSHHTVRRSARVDPSKMRSAGRVSRSALRNAGRSSSPMLS